jgi:hypothetical protein
LAKHRQQPRQRCRITSADSLLFASKPQKPIHHRAIQIADRNLFLLQPSAEIGDYDDLLSDGVASIALLGHTGRVSVEVLTQRPLPEPLNRAGKGKELVDHPPSVPGRATNYAAKPKLKRPGIATATSTCGIVPEAA